METLFQDLALGIFLWLGILMVIIFGVAWEREKHDDNDKDKKDTK